MPKNSYKKVFDAAFKDKDGKIVIWQNPNILLSGWILCLLLALVAKDDILHRGIQDLGRAVLFAWAYLEVRSGDSIFRRILGGVILISLVIGFFL